jgi:hypothetical protein
MVKVMADCWIMIDRPVAAARVWINTPVDKPNVMTIPFREPKVRLSVRTKRLSGPGISDRITEAAKNDKSNSIFMAAKLAKVSVHTYPFFQIVSFQNIRVTQPVVVDVRGFQAYYFSLILRF